MVPRKPTFSRFGKNMLNLCSWNIEGLTNDKVTDPYFQDIISKFELISFIETWTGENSPDFSLPNFELVHSSSRKKHKKARRFSGGICIFAKNSVKSGIKPVKNKHPDIVWVKLDHNFFKVKKDVYLGVVYISPESHSNRVNDIENLYSILLNDIEYYSTIGDIILQGDFNAYTCNEPDFVLFDNDSKQVNAHDKNYIVDEIMSRNNLDHKHTNNSGKILLNLCKESSMRILNGRKIGDLKGKPTCFTYNGTSVVDYSIVGKNLFNSIAYFEVHDFTSLSNHCPISLGLMSSFSIDIDTNVSNILNPLPGKFIWDNNAIKSYAQNLQSTNTKSKMDSFLKENFENSDEITDSFNCIIQECAFQSAKYVKSNPKIKQRKVSHKPWFTQSCKDLRYSVKMYEKLVNRSPSNGQYRKNFYTYRSKYRRLCKYEEKKFKQNICNELLQNVDCNPKVFWKLINKLDNLQSRNLVDALPYKNFTEFFKTLNTADRSYNIFQEKIIHEFETLKSSLDQITSDFIPITLEEIQLAIKSLKLGKSSSSDLISNEMLKHGGYYIQKLLEKLFNFILHSGKYPSKWNESFLVLIHKSGNKYEPGNYRGISITSNLGKLFNRVIYTRFLDIVNQHNLISDNQIGFKPNCRTADHLFTIKSIIEDYKIKKKKLYAGFIDLRKAFDTIWRVGLFYKLLKCNIPKSIFDILLSMYANTTTRIKFNCGLSEEFHSECGVKQGDVLSPLLFNIFINDIVKVLQSDSSDPVIINGVSINCLLYADDIVLLSNSKSGLQHSLNILSTFCNNWKLQVNVAKSKVIVFNSNGKTYQNDFSYNGNSLETVSKYCYLGIMLKHNGKFNLAISTLVDKARKAYFKVKKNVGLDNPCKLLEKLFDSLVSPILLYCCEIWGLDINDKDTSVIEKFHMKFIKEILGVHCKAANAACRNELNRLPLKAKIQFLNIKYWNHVTSNKTSLLYRIFNATELNNPWVKKMHSLFDNLGLSYIHLNKVTIKHLLPSIKQRLNDVNFQHNFSIINESSKLAFYKTYIFLGQRSAYVDILSKRSARSSLCKLKLSAHNLAIEQGRYINLPHEERICHCCNTGDIEDEAHFMFKCPKFVEQRFILKTYICNFYHIQKLTEKQFLHLCFKSKSFQILKMVSSYISKCLDIRSNILK